MSYHIEIHIAHSLLDGEKLQRAGLPTPLTSETCRTCEATLGLTLDGFTPYAVVLDEDRAWYLCLDDTPNDKRQGHDGNHNRSGERAA